MLLSAEFLMGLLCYFFLNIFVRDILYAFPTMRRIFFRVMFLPIFWYFLLVWALVFITFDTWLVWALFLTFDAPKTWIEPFAKSSKQENWRLFITRPNTNKNYSSSDKIALEIYVATDRASNFREKFSVNSVWLWCTT